MTRTAVTVGMRAAPAISPDIPLGQLVEFWIELRCCRGTAFHPVRLVATRLRGSASTTLGETIGRFRCRHCGSPPRTAAVVERADGGSDDGRGRRWRVEIVTGKARPL